MFESTSSKNDAKPQNLWGTLQDIVTKNTVETSNNIEPVTYEFTQDPALLQQYYCLRQTIYNKTFKSINFNTEEDYYDKLSHILIARRGHLCLGGCRLTIREGDEEWLLPTETDGYIFRDLFSELKLNQIRHAEISRFAITEDRGGDAILHKLCKIMYDKVLKSNINYLFVSSTYSAAKKWQLVSNRLGVKTTKIIKGIHPPDKILNDIKWYITLSDLTGFYHDDSMAQNMTKTSYDKISEIMY